jgi:hypothetical protein
VVNVLSLTSGKLKNVVATAGTATAGVTVLDITTSTAVIKVSSLMFANGGNAMATATLRLVSGGTTHPVAVGVDVDPQQAPVALITRASPLYLTGSQSLRANASDTNVAVIINYEELS